MQTNCRDDHGRFIVKYNALYNILNTFAPVLSDDCFQCSHCQKLAHICLQILLYNTEKKLHRILWHTSPNESLIHLTMIRVTRGIASFYNSVV